MIDAGDEIKFLELNAFIREFSDAWRVRDAETLAGLCHPDTIWEDPSIPGPVTGQDGVAVHVRTTVSAFSDLVFERAGDPALSAAGTIAYWPWRMIGTNDGPIDPPGFPATGRPINVPGINVMSFREGLLWRNLAIYDRAGMARQLGLMPAPRSRAEQLYVTMAQLRSKMPQGDEGK
jgi:ketosteroid isomerase-like protein